MNSSNNTVRLKRWVCVFVESKLILSTMQTQYEALIPNSHSWEFNLQNDLGVPTYFPESGEMCIASSFLYKLRNDWSTCYILLFNTKLNQLKPPLQWITSQIQEKLHSLRIHFVCYEASVSICAYWSEVWTLYYFVCLWDALLIRFCTFNYLSQSIRSHILENLWPESKY